MTNPAVTTTIVLSSHQATTIIIIIRKVLTVQTEVRMIKQAVQQLLQYPKDSLYVGTSGSIKRKMM